jgi:selenoprotein W-related protein
MAQEFLITFEGIIGEVALVPGTGGIFEVRAGKRLLWSRVKERRFPEISELKRIVRDHIAPGMDLGHAEGRRHR